MKGAISGLVNLDGKPINSNLVERMLSHGPVGCTATNIVQFGQATFGACGLHSSSGLLSQCIALSSETLGIAWAGRLDNRKNLLKELELSIKKGSVVLDAEIVLHLYKSWRENCVRKLIGEFAFCIWDQEAKNFLCAVDHYAIVPLFYHFDGKELTFGSRIVQIYQNKNIQYKLDEKIIDEYFHPWNTLNETTFSEEITGYKGIKRLPHGCLLLVSKKGTHLQKYWDINPDREIIYSKDSDYYEHFEELFREAVSCRLETQKQRVGFQLTGGLDSSSIVAMAHDIFKKNRDQRGITTFTINFDELSCNERPYADIVINACQAEGIFITGEWLLGEWNLPLGTQKPYDFHRIELNNIPNASEAIFQAAYDREIDVILSGHGADFYLEGNETIFDSLVRKLSFKRFLEEFNAALSGHTLKDKIKVLRDFTLAPLLPKKWSIPLFYKQVYMGTGYQDLPDFFSERFRQTISSQKLKYQAIPKMRNWGQQDDYSTLFPPVYYEEKSNLPIDVRYPYLDKRLIEFGMAIPPEKKFSYMEGKSFYRRSKLLHRKGLSRNLPEAIRKRSIKTTYEEVTFCFFRNFARDIRELFKRTEEPILYEKGYLNPDKFEETLEALLSSPERSLCREDNSDVWIRKIISAEIWLRTFSSRDTQASLID